MQGFAGDSEEIQLLGTLRFEEIEGGFWSLDLDAAIDGLGDHGVLAGYTPDPGFADGMRLRVHARTLPGAIGFRMAGPEVEVLDARPA